MGYFLRVGLASFLVGAATASAVGLYVLNKDYKVAHQAISQQQLDFLPPDERPLQDFEWAYLSSGEVDAPQHVEATEYRS